MSPTTAVAWLTSEMIGLSIIIPYLSLRYKCKNVSFIIQNLYHCIAGVQNAIIILSKTMRGLSLNHWRWQLFSMARSMGQNTIRAHFLWSWGVLQTSSINKLRSEARRRSCKFQIPKIDLAVSSLSTSRVIMWFKAVYSKSRWLRNKVVMLVTVSRSVAGWHALWWRKSSGNWRAWLRSAAK